MNLDPAELEELKSLHPAAEVVQEAGVDLVRLPGLRLPSGCAPSVVDALLHPTSRDGYPSRLFVSQQVTPCRARNWAGAVLLGTNWQVYSWKRDNAAPLSLIQKLAFHLDAFRP